VVVRTLAFVVVRQVRLIGLGPSPDAKDVEIAVLRHQLLILRRQVARPRYAPADRTMLAALAKLLPRDRWPIFLVTPATLLRWHRELIRRWWTYPATGPGRRALDPAVVDPVLRLARENPRWDRYASSANAASSAYRYQQLPWVCPWASRHGALAESVWRIMATTASFRRPCEGTRRWYP